MRMLLVAVVAVATALAAPPARACTTFLLKPGHEVIVGKSYDYTIGQALLVFNKRWVVKQALRAESGATPARWTSKYASLTFNQFGREIPNGGMNEAGLVVEVMSLAAAVTPPPDARPTVNELQFIQWLLDQFGTVGEVVAHAHDVRVHRVYMGVHYLACDAGGACAAIDHVNGRLVVTSGRTLTVPVLTNNTYAESIEFLTRHRGFGGDEPLPAGTDSLSRFARAAAYAMRGPASPVPAAAFAALDDVRMPDYTKWNIVYMPKQRRIYWRTAAQGAVKSVDLKKFATACGTPVRVLDIDTAAPGDATGRFEEYTTAANEALVRSSYENMVSKLPPGAVERVVHYPESFPCATSTAPHSRK
jgi:penicillin V acylase-like amidase (Ntn superfamily)